nr:hypothetical protein CFP56_60775 [Quercus suber]
MTTPKTLPLQIQVLFFFVCARTIILRKRPCAGRIPADDAWTEENVTVHPTTSHSHSNSMSSSPSTDELRPFYFALLDASIHPFSPESEPDTDEPHFLIYHQPLLRQLSSFMTNCPLEDDLIKDI